MKWQRLARGWIAVLCSIVLMGAGAALVTPAANALGSINWGSAWKHEVKPRADKVYVSKQQAAKKYAPMPKVIRGTYISQMTAAAAGNSMSADISFGWNVGTAPTVHVIAPGAPAPAGCSGTVAAPGAAPGNLCVFERVHVNASAPLVCSATAACAPSASPFGALLVAASTAGGVAEISGSWAVSPATRATASKVVAGQAKVRPGPVGR